MIKFAVVSDNNTVSEHFGHCAEFIIFDAEDGKITKVKVANQSIAVSPNFLADMGVNVIISEAWVRALLAFLMKGI